MRDILVAFELDSLGVDQEQAHLLRRVSKQQAGQNRIEADALACSRGSGDQQMGHSGKVRHDRLAGDIFPESNGQSCLGCRKGFGFHNRPDGNRFASKVRNFYADGRLSGNGRDHPDADGLESHGQVIRQADDTADFDAWRRSILVHRDDGPGGNRYDFSLHAKIRELLFQNPRVFL